MVSLGGGYVRGDSRRARADHASSLQQAVPFPPQVVRARFGADASLRGAVALALASGTRSTDGSARVILTVTANVAIDRTYVIDQLEVGAVHKVRKAYAKIGGKGVNVSRCVQALGG